MTGGTTWNSARYTKIIGSMLTDRRHNSASDFWKCPFFSFKGMIGVAQLLTRQYLAPNLLLSLVVFQRNP